MDAEQQFQTAAQLYQSGDFPAAEAALEALAETLPGNPNVLHLLSLARLRQNKAEAAADSLRELTDLVPGSAEAHDLLGCALRQAGRINAAIRHLRKAVEISPDAANIHYNLGNAYRDDRQVDKAMAHFKRATELDPSNLNAFFNLGQTYFNAEDMHLAIEAFYTVVQKAPNDLEAQALLARTAFLANFYVLARKACEDALALAPGNPDLLALLAESATHMSDFETAAKAYDELLASRPGDAALMRQKAAILRAKGDAEGALEMCRKAAAAAPGDTANIAELGRLLERLNRLDEARDVIAPALDAHAGDPALNLVAARLERRDGDRDKALSRLKALDPAALAVSPALGEIRFEMGFLYDRLERPGDAVDNFEQGNAFLARNKKTADMFRERSSRYLERLKTAFDSPDAQPTRTNAQAGGERTPVFLVGFPRSGTTLLDQVMDAHPAIQVLEEQPTLSAVRDRLLVRNPEFPADLFDIPEGELEALRGIYFEAVDRVIQRDPQSLLIDKMPLNILDVGLIHRLFPDARFILALRHPCDVCLSCFMQPFELNEGMVHFTRLDETVQFYDEVMSLWQVQREALNLNVHQVRYEDLVTGLEPVARGLLEFLGVPWDDRVLDPTGHARAQGVIGTNSYHQVVQDLNTKAVDRWRKYEIHLAPHLGRLRPHLAAFGYGEGER